MQRPLQIKKVEADETREPPIRRGSKLSGNMGAEQLSDIDEEEEKRMANAFEEANAGDNAYRSNTMQKKKMALARISRVCGPSDN